MNIECRRERKRMNIDYRKMVRRRRGYLELIYGAKRRLPSIFDIPCSSFDIPAFGGSFFKRSLEKSVGPSGLLKASLNEQKLQKMQHDVEYYIIHWNLYTKRVSKPSIFSTSHLLPFHPLFFNPMKHLQKLLISFSLLLLTKTRIPCNFNFNSL